ncbi:MAG: sulfate adenylyltransferase subunit CysD [Hydrogenovibrio sp.]|uniref:sulfate adenylyltransferase subunit CysD n=1 Tax=Hydrogenovibrio sp. TaxID=2065821 RepID=UPI0028705D10|nr:sulfate adenylyltransferase subunit CysD [Hydrogenovibrio sp.]MDR9499844.1 sulfate adenylyltransferase subunit CysD [Hydrogenovibrio sp.]
MQTGDYLQSLESQSIHIMREAVAEARRPAMLYSVGKDSSVMLHLAQKAFAPARLPFPVVHVDTLWKFQEMIAFRDRRAEELGLDLIVHTNPAGIAQNISPFVHGSRQHTDIMKTEALKQVLDEHGFDMVFGGARRDEEKSRAKERIFSVRDASHRWRPEQQRPEFWQLYNATPGPTESMRVFPLSNWTELDVWLYIQRENIPVPDLYFARPRPVAEHEGTLILTEDTRTPETLRAKAHTRTVRFRTLGCFPLTGAIESDATTVEDLIAELMNSRVSERQGRLIDFDDPGSMEKKKMAGYF